MSEGGTYTLLLDRTESATVEVGALGPVTFPPGSYAYVGSALGSAGFGRVDRHRRVAAGDHEVRHWHVDYLTGAPATRLLDVATSAGVDAECAVAARLRAAGLPEPVRGFGSSDCACPSHLFGPTATATLRTAVSEAHGAVEE